ncbi:hypothetical protein [Bacillus sp. 1P06AnD]|uniref:hypothetical protein n=1 Tax=Bacillus sp. 1P06AnD TaxID=3132208 RepID=UPI0039A3F06B
MKTAIVNANEGLKRIVSHTLQFEECMEVRSLEELQKHKKMEVIVLEQCELNAMDIIQLRETFPSQKILVVADEIDAFFEKSCVAHDILLVSKEWAERDQLKVIQKSWFGLEEQTEYHNVVVFKGTHRQVGVTQLALSTGLAISRLNYKTLVIGLNPYNPGEIVTSPATYSFDQVYDLLQTNVINGGESLLPYLEKVENLYYLPGNRDYYKAAQYEGAAVERLIHYAKEYFDIVLLDVGAFYDSYLPLTALQMSNTHILVSSQEQLSIDEYKRWNEQVLNRFAFFPKTTYQIINKFATKAILTAKHLEEKQGVPLLMQVPYFPEANDAEIEDGILYLSEYAPFVKAIDGLAKTIGNEISGIHSAAGTTKNALFGFLKVKAK